MLGGNRVGKEHKPKAVAIAHMRLDHKLAKPDGLRRKQMATRLRTADECRALLEEDYAEFVNTRDAAQTKRIKEINAYLGAHENALAQTRLRGSPMTLLIEKASAKGEELMAAQEIELAYMALAGALMFKPISMEKTSPGAKRDWSPRTTGVVQQYQAWANHWSQRRKAHLDYTLECVIAAVIDQRPIRVIGEDLGFHHTKIERAVLGGLRDYAARAGWVDGKIAKAWMEAAEQTFNRRVAA